MTEYFKRNLLKLNKQDKKFLRYKEMFLRYKEMLDLFDTNSCNPDDTSSCALELLKEICDRKINRIGV